MVTNESGAVLKPYLNKDGYLALNLPHKGSKFKIKIHRAVAKAFIRNRKGLPMVNHKDGNKQNNNVDNLEWSTYSDNSKHAYANGLSKHTPAEAGAFVPVPVMAIPLDPEITGIWFPSMASAKKHGFCPRSIRRVVKGDQIVHKGYKWERMNGDSARV